ncbi:MAG: hypothetical protein QM640_04720 [Niabella sp.]
MSVNKERLKYLLRKSIAKQCTAAEKLQLHDLAEKTDNHQLAQLLDEIYEEIKTGTGGPDLYWEHAQMDILLEPHLKSMKTAIKEFLKRRWIIIIFLLLLLGVCYITTCNHKIVKNVVAAQEKDLPVPIVKPSDEKTVY